MILFPNTLTTFLQITLLAKAYLAGGQFLLEDESMQKRKFLER
jgi:hypothetical protein